MALLLYKPEIPLPFEGDFPLSLKPSKGLLFYKTRAILFPPSNPVCFFLEIIFHRWKIRFPWHRVMANLRQNLLPYLSPILIYSKNQSCIFDTTGTG